MAGSVRHFSSGNSPSKRESPSKRVSFLPSPVGQEEGEEDMEEEDEEEHEEYEDYEEEGIREEQDPNVSQNILMIFQIFELGF